MYTLFTAGSSLSLESDSPLKPFDTFRAYAAQSRGARHSFDARAVTETVRHSLASAGLQTDTGPMKVVTETIERALAAGGLLHGDAEPDVGRGRTIDGTAYEVRAERPHRRAPRGESPLGAGRFIDRTFVGDAGTLTYKLYVPARHDAKPGEPMPLIVMLHGCGQSPDDFAAGTRMNTLADEHGFLVAYPGQSRHSNGSNCWNWFKVEHHARDGGEPALIAGVARAIADEYGVDRRRMFVAGLSAGAAMAVILGETHPELFAAVGAHSGLPYAAAHDVPSAYAAMNGGGIATGMSHLGGKRRMRRPPTATPANAIPTIVFHGDADATVNARNGAEIAEQATHAAQASAAYATPLRRVATQGTAPGGRTLERIVLSDANGRPLVEEWLLHGAGHAWSGGSRAGSFTDPDGPDASAEIVRFFLAQQTGPGSPYRLT